MTIRTTRKQLLTGTSAVALAASLSLMSHSAFAADEGWVTLASPEAQTQTAGNNGDVLAITGANVITAGANIGATNTNKTGTAVTVNATSAAAGIISTGDNSAISVTGTGTITTAGGGIVITKGTVSSAATTATKGSIALNGDDSTNNIDISANGTVSNTGGGATSNAIYIGSTGANVTTITNAGTISAASGQGISIEDKAGSTVTIANSGTLTASGGSAVIVAAGNNTQVNFSQTAGSTVGAIDLSGNNVAGSTISLTGGTVTGDIAMGNAAQVLTLGGATVTGKIDGPGIVNATQNFTSNGNIGSGTGVTTINVTDGKTFDLSTHNNTVTATNVIVGTAATTDAVLKIGTGTVTGTIKGDAAGHGVVTFVGSNTLGGNVGSTKLKTINITDGTTLTAGNNNLTATTINVGTSTAGATLSIGTGTITGAVESSAAGKGTINFVNNNTLAAGTTIGSTTGFATINITDNKEVDAATNNNAIKATNVILGTGAAGSTLDLGTATLVGKIDGSTGHAGTGTLNFVGNNTTNGNIGSTTALAAVVVSDGVTVHADTHNNSIAATAITLGDAAGGGATLTLGTGGVTGTIDGDADGNGVLNLTQDTVINGDIGATHDLASVVITDGKTVNFATHNNALNADATTVGTGANGATLTLGTGSLAGTIDSSANGKGTLNFNGSATLNGDIGDTHPFATIAIASGKTIDGATNNSAVDATNITLASGSTLKMGTGQLTGLVDGTAGGNGTLTFAGNMTTASNIGATHSLGAVTVSNGATVVFNNNVSASATTIGTGASGVLTVNAGKTLTTNSVTLKTGATLNQQTTGIISGAVDGDANGHGTYNITTAGTFTQNNAIGATHSLASFTTANGVIANLSKNISASAATFGGGASGTITQSNGTITAPSTIGVGATFTQTGGSIVGAVTMNNNSTLTINGGDGFSSTLDADGNGHGTLAVDSTFATTSTVGANHNLAAINVNAGGDLTLGGNTKATTTTVTGSGVLHLGSATHTVTGDITGATTGTVDIGGKTQNLTGNLSLGANNTLGVTVNSGTLNDAGKLAATGNADLAVGTKIAVHVDSSAFVSNNQTYLILTGTNADVHASTISDDSAVLSFTEDLGNAGERTLVAHRATYQSVASSANDSLATALTTLGSSNNTQIKALEGQLDSASSATALDNVLKSAQPQVNATTVQVVNDVGQSLDVVSDRIENLYAGMDTSINGMAAGGKVADHGIWIQGFGTTATQDLRAGVDGYDADTLGVAVGADKMVSDRTRLGLSASYAHTTVDANGANIQNTDIDSYQGNLYGTYDMGKWYAEGLVGAAYQQFNSDRHVAGVIASGDFNGETYTARAGAGYRMMANNIDITPKASLTYMYNHVDGYTETGAGGLDAHVGSDNTEALIGKVGADFSHDFHSAGMLVRPVLRLAYMYDFIGDQADTTSYFTGGGGTFHTRDANPEQSSFDIGASLNLMRSDNITFSADYDFNVKSDYDSHSGMLRARVAF